MAKKDNASLQANIEIYEKYFSEDLKAIEEELEKSKHYSSIIDAEVDKLSAPSLGANKGSQHYLIEHITNAVQLQTQRQGLRRDRFAIKKAIIDYACKFADDIENGSSEEMFAAVEKLVKEKLKENNISSKSETTENLDDDIDKILNNNE